MRIPRVRDKRIIRNHVAMAAIASAVIADSAVGWPGLHGCMSNSMRHVIFIIIKHAQSPLVQPLPTPLVYSSYTDITPLLQK